MSPDGSSPGCSSTGTLTLDPEEDAFVAGQTYVQGRLFQTGTLNIIDPVVSFEGMDTPFRSMRIAPERVGQVDFDLTDAAPFFWVERLGGRVRFDLVATDWSGREIAFSLPLMFILGANPNLPLDQLQQRLDSAPADHRTIELGGAPVTLADPGSRDDVTVEQVTLPVHTVVMELVPSPFGAARALVPRTVDVALDAVGRLTSQAEKATCKLMHQVDDAGNFLEMTTGLPVAFPAAQVGGLASPDTLLETVNAAKGAIPTGAVEAIFGQAKLLGVQLLDLLPALPEPPTIVSVQAPDKVTTTYDWTPELTTGQHAGVLRLGEGAELHLHASLEASIDLTTLQPQPPTATITGSLTKATVSLLDAILVRLREARVLEDLPHRSPSVSASTVRRVTLRRRDLKFVQDLAKEIQSFGAGCPISVDPSGITAAYELALPPVGHWPVQP